MSVTGSIDLPPETILKGLRQRLARKHREREMIEAEIRDTLRRILAVRREHRI